MNKGTMKKEKLNTIYKKYQKNHKNGPVPSVLTINSMTLLMSKNMKRA